MTLDHGCPNCLSVSIRIEGELTPVAKVVCGECNAVLSTWEDFKTAARERFPERRAAPPKKRARSSVVSIWGSLGKTMPRCR